MTMEIVDPPRKYAGYYWLWIKHRTTWAGHYGQWDYTEQPISRLEREKAELKSFVEELANRYDYSDKFRGIKWMVVDMPPRAFLARHLERMKREAIYTNGCHARAQEHLNLTAWG